MKTVLLGLFLAMALCAPVQAFQLHVRDNDTGVMTEVESIDPDRVVDFVQGSWVPTDQCEDPVTLEVFECEPVIRWGPQFEGQGWECRTVSDETSLNPLIGRDRTVQGFLPNGALTGNPSAPLTIHYGNWRETGTVFNYFSRAAGTLISQSYGGCGAWGDSTWAMKFDTPRTAFAITFNFHDGMAGERVHLEFWDDDGRLVGHQDVVNSAENTLENTTFSWTSLVGVAGFSMWIQNGPGVGIVLVALGEADLVPPQPLTLEERVLRLEEIHGIVTQ